MSTPRTVTVHILDKEYPVACPPDQEQALRDAARHLDEQMRTIRASGKVIGLERIAVMAALNISHELLQTAAREARNAATAQHIQRLDQQLDDALNRFRPLDLP